MDFEDYLIEEEYPLLAIKNIIEKLDDTIFANFGEILSETNKDLIEQILSLIWAINTINNVMLKERKNAYKTIADEYDDDYSS
jgi:hypothetical protein